MRREVMAIRLDQRTRARVERMARRRRQPTSEAVRQAIEAWVERQEGEANVYELVADLIGCVEGPSNLSAGGGRRVVTRRRARGRKASR